MNIIALNVLAVLVIVGVVLLAGVVLYNKVFHNKIDLPIVASCYAVIVIVLIIFMCVMGVYFRV